MIIAQLERLGQRDIVGKMREWGQRVFSQKERSPYRLGTQEYLLPIKKEKNLTEGKRHYLDVLETLVETMPFPQREVNIIILGAGRNFEAERIDRALRKREKAGENLKRVKIKIIDHNQEILDCIRVTTKSQRIKAGLVLGDVTEIGAIRDKNGQEIIPANSAILVAMSAIMHETGEKGMYAFAEARRILAPEGMLIFRDFLLLTRRRQMITLNTEMARIFIKKFIEENGFLPEEKARWRHDWKRRGDVVECNATLAFEIVQHFRFFMRDYQKMTDEEKSLAFKYFPQWRDRLERYSLVIPVTKSVKIKKIMEALIIAVGKSPQDYAYSYQRISDSEDDKKLIQDHLTFQERRKDGELTKSSLLPSKRMVCYIYKFAKEKTLAERLFLAQEQHQFVVEIGKKARLRN